MDFLTLLKAAIAAITLRSNTNPQNQRRDTILSLSHT